MNKGSKRNPMQNFSDSNQVINDYLFCLDNNQRQIKAARQKKLQTSEASPSASADMNEMDERPSVDKSEQEDKLSFSA